MFEWNMARLVVKSEQLKKTCVTMRWDRVLKNNRQGSIVNAIGRAYLNPDHFNEKENLHFDLLATYSNFCISMSFLKLEMMVCLMFDLQSST